MLCNTLITIGIFDFSQQENVTNKYPCLLIFKLKIGKGNVYICCFS